MNFELISFTNADELARLCNWEGRRVAVPY
jgi:hypothetical protein